LDFRFWILDYNAEHMRQHYNHVANIAQPRRQICYISQTEPVQEARMSELLYGRNAVREALRAGRRKPNRLLLAEGVLVQEDSGTLGEAVAEAQRQGIVVLNVPRLRLDQMTDGANHQGVALDAGPYPYADFNDLLALLPGQQDPLVLALDHLQDPQNVATLLRTAEAVGVAGVALPERRAALITPAVSNASAGAVEHLQIAMVNNLPRAIAQLQAAGLWVAGLQEEGAQLYNKVDLRGPLVIVVGSEGSGLQRLTAEKCDFLLRLPMFGRIESLNAAVAGSIVLYEATRQRTEALASEDEHSPIMTKVSPVHYPCASSSVLLIGAKCLRRARTYFRCGGCQRTPPKRIMPSDYC
jgi:23S rRNA (guanosine2251-2'-O)-methyltransferase